MIVDEAGEAHKSNRSQMFFKIGVLKNFAKFTGKHLCWSWFLIKLHVNIVKFLRTAFFLEHLRWLLLSTAINRRYSEK